MQGPTFGFILCKSLKFFFFSSNKGPHNFILHWGSHKLHSLSCLENWPCWLLGFMHKQSEAGRPSAEPASPCGACSRIGGSGAWLSSAHSLFSLHSPLISLSHPPICASWDHFSDTLLVFDSLPQGLLVKQLNPQQWLKPSALQFPPLQDGEANLCL